MRVLTTSIITALALTASQAYAGNGDLIVKGNASIGTTTPASPLTIGTPVYTTANPTLTGSQVNISDQPVTTSGQTSIIHIVSQPNPSTNSTAVYTPIYLEQIVPVTSTLNYATLGGFRSRVDHYGTGTANFEQAVTGTVYNQSTSGTVNTQQGGMLGAYNMSTGIVNNQYGSRSSAQNGSGGTVTSQFGSISTSNNYLNGYVANSYGIYTQVSNSHTGTIGTAYGLAVGDSTYDGMLNPSGTITTGYGVFVGAINASNKWAVYSKDATAPSYFAGNVGIGTTSPAFTLDVQGLVASNNIVLTSDAKFKKNLLSISNPLDKVLNLNGLSYEWKADEYKEKNFPEGRHYGVIAQEIEKVLPEVVNTDAKGDKSVAYTEIIPVLIEAMKEQQNLIKEQQKLIMSQGKRISDLEEVTSKLTK